ncbi:MAG: amino acid ABC transporter permease [Clostridium sp.]
MDFSFIQEYIPRYFDGAKYTIIVSLITVLFGVLFGSLLYFMKSSKLSIFKIRPLRVIAVVYVEIIRGTPMLLQIMMMYAGSKMFFGIDLSAFTSAIIAISMNSAAYVSEIIRAGIDAVDKGQMEAARSLGMTRVQAMRLVVIPQAIRNILPAIGNEFVTIIKESSMASVIGVGELMFVAKGVSGATYKAFEPLMVAAVFYFVLTFSLGRAMAYLERRLKASDTH